jgi:hypothetical protein
MRLLAAFAIVAAAACHHGPDADELRHDLTVALANYTQAMHDEAPKLREAVAALALDMSSPDAAHRDVHDRVLPLLDSLVFVGDRALAASDAYQATGGDVDPTTAARLKQIRGRSDILHRLRDRLAAPNVQLTGPASEELLQSAGYAAAMLMNE